MHPGYLPLPPLGSCSWRCRRLPANAVAEMVARLLKDPVPAVRPRPVVPSRAGRLIRVLDIQVKMSYFKVGPTELRILLAIGNLALLVHPMAVVFGHQYRLFDVGGAVAVVGLRSTLLFAAAANARTLYLAEPISSPATD